MGYQNLRNQQQTMKKKRRGRAPNHGQTEKTDSQKNRKLGQPEKRGERLPTREPKKPIHTKQENLL